MNVDVHLNVGAMALGALPADEAREFAVHLSDCGTCAAELAGFSETAARLGAAVAAAPPARLKASVLQAVRVIPQLPPLTPPPSTVPTPGRTGSPVAETVPGGRHRPAPAPVVDELAARRWYRRPQVFLAAAAVAAVLVVGGILLGRSNTPVPSAASCVTQASDRQTLTPGSGAAGDVVYAKSCGAATVTPAGLPTPPAGRVYQLWALKNGDATTARSLGIIAEKNGGLDQVQAQIQGSETDLAISLEPGPNGSTAPTAGQVKWTTHLT